MHRLGRLLTTTILSLLLAAALSADQGLTALSPGQPDRSTEIATRCPTFSWGGASAPAYELAVFRVGEGEDGNEPVLRRTIAGPAFSWTPDSEACFEAGGRYAWTVRSVGGARAEWSEPLLFDVAAAPSADEFRQALEVVQRYLESQASGEAAAAAIAGDEPSAVAPQPAAAPTPPSAPVDLNRDPKMVVEGELRTVDSDGDPRLWGKGRPGAEVYGKQGGGLCIKGANVYGLSHLAVTWASAAHACPAGSWVCSSGEVGICDTSRPDNGFDWWDCSGAGQGWDPDKHSGWLASSSSISSTHLAFSLAEAGDQPSNETPVSFALPVCYERPVWCCWTLSFG